MSIHPPPTTAQIATTQILATRNKTPANSTIAVLSLEPSAGPGVIAVVSVKVGCVTIRGIKVCDRGRGVYCNMPSHKPSGHWEELVSITTPAVERVVVELVLDAVRDWTVTR